MAFNLSNLAFWRDVKRLFFAYTKRDILLDDNIKIELFELQFTNVQIQPVLFGNISIVLLILDLPKGGKLEYDKYTRLCRLQFLNTPKGRACRSCLSRLFQTISTQAFEASFNENTGVGFDPLFDVTGRFSNEISDGTQYLEIFIKPINTINFPLEENLRITSMIHWPNRYSGEIGS